MQDADLDIMEIRRNNFISKVSKYGSQGQIAKALGVSTGYVYQIVNGMRNIGERSAVKFEQRLNLPSGWLSTIPDDHDGLNTEPPRPSQQHLPVLSWEDAPLGMDQPLEIIPAAWGSAKTCFALKIDTEVMSPELPVGGYICVSPRYRYANGDIVVYRAEGASSVSVRRLVSEGGVNYLQPSNPQFPLVQLDSQEILGTVLYYQRQFVKGK